MPNQVRNMKTKIIVLIVLIAVLQVSAEVRFVSKNGSSTAPYTSWATAADSIQKAIDLCNAGDTVVVANGVYKEALLASKVITLLGTSMDSTIIDCGGVFGKKEKWTKILFEDTATIRNFTIVTIDHIYEDSSSLIISYHKSTIIENCRLKNGAFGIGGLENNFYINNVIFEKLNSQNITAVYSGLEGLTITKNCLFIQRSSPNYTGNGGSHIYTNNIISPLAVKFPGSGVSIYFSNEIEFSNNLFIGIGAELAISGFCNSAKILNNAFLSGKNRSILVSSQNFIIKNNIFANGVDAVNIYQNSLGIVDYNLFWNNRKDINNNSYLGSHNIYAAPMFIADSSSINGRGDFHLQKYSPAIDTGDPEIKDADGSRSDIGAYGGLLGESYAYRDLAPMTPVNVKIEAAEKQLKLKWNKNTEADFSFYRIYRDTVKNFKADSSKKISEISDTIFIDAKPVKNNLFYKITAVDKQDNESLVSEEVGYFITGIEKGKIMVNDYALYQNYPNPFNPRTKIGYKLKENGKVRLTVYDIQGKLVAALLNNTERNAGYHEEEFPIEKTNPLASGIYICRIEILNTGGIPVFSDSIKMLSLK